jgi:hypothetical protein
MWKKLQGNTFALIYVFQAYKVSQIKIGVIPFLQTRIKRVYNQ